VWLNTTPEKQEQTRYERFIAEDFEVILPEIRCSYLFDYLMKIGAVSSNGMGTVSLSWQEINGWLQATGVPLNAWEVAVIHRASDAYAVQLQASYKPDCPMPERVIEQDPVKLKNHIKNVLR
jgi:hypothetical protein